MSNSHHTTVAHEISYRLAPPPVKSPECGTAFEVGTNLLIDDSFSGAARTKQRVVTVEKVSVNIHALSDGRSYRSVVYGLRDHNPGPGLRSRYTVTTEHELQTRFIAHVW